MQLSYPDFKLEDFLFKNKDNFTNHLLNLIDRKDLYERQNLIQKNIFGKIFGNTKKMFQEHIEIIDEFSSIDQEKN